MGPLMLSLLQIHFALFAHTEIQCNTWKTDQASLTLGKLFLSHMTYPLRNTSHTILLVKITFHSKLSFSPSAERS